MTKHDTTASPRRSTSQAVLPAIVAVGGSVAAAPAGAIQLGDIQVQSTLGQPLRASIAYALGPNETLENYCVNVANGPSGSGLPTVPTTRVRVADGVITLTSSRPVREPMVAVRLSITCPYTPNLTREYMMFIDPANPAVTPAPESRAAATVTAAAPVTREAPPSPRAPARSEPVVQGARYRVQPGETLSEIVQLVENRSIALWPAVNAIFEANPEAFINADPNRLKAGSWLTIPDFVGNEVSQFASVADAATAAAETSVDSVTGTGSAASAPVPQTAEAELAAAEIAAVTETESTRVTATDATADSTAEASNVAADIDPFANDTADANETIIIPDTPLESPAVSDNPNRTVARIEPASAQPIAAPVEEGSSWGRTLLFTGGGIGLLVALLFFGRGIFGRFGSTPVAVDTPPVRRRELEPETTMEVEESNFQLDDDSPTDQNPTLDADLVLGHELDGEVDVNFDDGFHATQAIDFELPEGEVAAQTSEETDIIPPPQIEESSILASEVLPEDDDYDMSVIVDVTKMPASEEVTERDLQAIEVEDKDDDEYTLNDAIDYDILEQDYQDELTATQALNMEIEKAAKELNDRLMDEEEDIDATTNVQISDIAELDVTAEVPAPNEELLSDLDDTNVNETLDPADLEVTEVLAEEKTVDMQRDESTVEMPTADATAEMPALDATAEMPAIDEEDDDKTLEVITSDGDHTVEVVTRDDDTVEMEVESGRVDTKAI
ncbi:MAG: hypothetical protein AAGF72_10580 [Pseudomonadota bacterium]